MNVKKIESYWMAFSAVIIFGLPATSLFFANGHQIIGQELLIVTVFLIICLTMLLVDQYSGRVRRIKKGVHYTLLSKVCLDVKSGVCRALVRRYTTLEPQVQINGYWKTVISAVEDLYVDFPKLRKTDIDYLLDERRSDSVFSIKPSLGHKEDGVSFMLIQENPEHFVFADKETDNICQNSQSPVVGSVA